MKLIMGSKLSIFVKHYEQYTMEGITYISEFLKHPNELFTFLIKHAIWNNKMNGRKTASYGVAYNYSQISYPYQPLLPELKAIANTIQATLGFEPNNCLINYYLDGRSKMGFHSDQINMLDENTGVVIISLGETRILRFRNIAQKDKIIDFPLPEGSLIYMEQSVQDNWQHAIPSSDAQEGTNELNIQEDKITIYSKFHVHKNTTAVFFPENYVQFLSLKG